MLFSTATSRPPWEKRAYVIKSFVLFRHLLGSENHAAGRAGVSSGPSVLWIYSALPSGGHAGNDAHASNSYSDAISMAFRE